MRERSFSVTASSTDRNVRGFPGRVLVSIVNAVLPGRSALIASAAAAPAIAWADGHSGMGGVPPNSVALLAASHVASPGVAGSELPRWIAVTGRQKFQ